MGARKNLTSGGGMGDSKGDRGGKGRAEVAGLQLVPPLYLFPKGGRVEVDGS